MSKFQVGDKVRVLPEACEENGIGSGDTGEILRGWSGGGGYDIRTNDRREGGFYSHELEFDLAVAESEPDVISHPNHYTSGLPEGVEVIDIIRAQRGSWEHSNSIKYVLRAQYKGNYKQDIAKAIQYLTWAAERWED